MKCKICESNTKKINEVKVMKCYKTNLFHCENCDYLFLENPYWLEEAYKDPINISDTGIVDRNINLAAKLSVLIYFFFDRKKKFLDASGGYGILTRLMRDHGFNFFWSDKYCENILAKGFESKNNSSENYELLTLFEVLEHVENPVHFVDDLLKKNNSQTLIFSTCLYPRKNPPNLDWWYYSFGEGQHISFYSDITLKFVAKKLDLNFYALDNFYIFTKRKLRHLYFKKFIFGNFFSKLFQIYLRKYNDSLIMKDHKKLILK